MQLLDVRKSSRRRRLGWRLFLIIVPVAAVAAWLSWDTALARYHIWKEKRALQQAREFIGKHDPLQAQLALEVAFTVAPGDIELWRAAAEMLDQVGTPESLRIRRHIVQMKGANLHDQVALINAALRFRDFNAARDALASIPADQAAQPEALTAALSFALATENSAVADAIFDRIKASTPNNEDFKVAQSILHLRHPDPKVSAEARRALEAASANPKYALHVERELVSDALIRRDYVAAKRWLSAVVADPQSTLGDRLNQANVELLVDKVSFATVFAPLASRASGSNADAAAFAQWLLIQRRAKEADQWLATLPPDIRKSEPVLSVQTEVIAQLQDWNRLAPLVEAGAWGPVPPEVVRLAMSARVVGARNPALQREVWNEAVQDATGNLAALIALERFADMWRWESESEATLLAIARGFPDQTWVHQVLFNAYRSRNDTNSMREVMDILRNADPAVPRYQHDWALLGLLLEPTLEWNRPKEIMRELYTADPKNPNYATGYAFALAQAGKGPQALAIVAPFSTLERDYSPRAPYLAYIYGLNRNKSEVARLENLSRGTRYLPEEFRLFAAAHELENLKPAVPSAVRPAPAAKP